MNSRRLVINNDFHDACNVTRQAIHACGFLLLHEIDTTAIMKNAGYTVGNIRQLLFFHPRYMKIILEKDAESVIRVPLKIVLQSTREGETVVISNAPLEIFADCKALAALSEELDQNVSAILTRIECLSV